MSQITKDINKITGTIIGVSGKLILYALILLLLTEGIVRGYAFGHTIFYQTPMEPAPGSNKVLTVTAEDSGADIAAALKDLGLTSKEILRLLSEGPEAEKEEENTESSR